MFFEKLSFEPKLIDVSFEEEVVKIDVKIEEGTVWLTQRQIAQLFGTQRPAITKHLNNIFKSGELNKKSTCSKMEHVGSTGRIYKTKYYNLDAIISVGYRVNSKRATQFRIWAIKTLRNHIYRAGRVLQVSNIFTYDYPDNRFDTVSLLDIIKTIEKIKNEIKDILTGRVSKRTLTHVLGPLLIIISVSYTHLTLPTN